MKGGRWDRANVARPFGATKQTDALPKYDVKPHSDKRLLILPSYFFLPGVVL